MAYLMRILRTVVLCSFAGGILAVGGMASPADVAAVKSRQDKFRDLGSALKSVNDEVKKREPNWDIIQPSADTVQNRSKFIPTWFPKGSGPEAGTWSGVNGPGRTYALPLIWQKPDDFAKLAKVLIDESAKLNSLAAAKNLGGLRDQYRVVAEACKSCHKAYRSSDYEKDNPDQ